MNNENPEWMTLKRYPHIGFPLKRENRKGVVQYITNTEKIAHHSFTPLIRRVVITHPYRFNDEKGRKTPKPKKRDLTYASHFDSAIFSYYADQLQREYENFIEKNGLGEVVVAYRRIPTSNNQGNKCNIHIANDVFQYVRKRVEEGEELALVTFDIKGFFDSLDHKLLKKSWKKVMNWNDMPEDVYNVYKNVTKFSYVCINSLFPLFKDRIWCESAGKYVQKSVKRVEYMRDKKAVAFCKREDVDIVKKQGYLQVNKTGKGIPQGLPISAVLANVYMCDFDIRISRKLKDAGGIYKRYSDDIVIVCPSNTANQLREDILNEIKKVDLEIQKEKTNLYYISLKEGKIICSHESKGPNKKIEYLGFSFDGEHILLKHSGLCKYYDRMRRAKNRHIRWAISIKNNTRGEVFEHPMYKHYSLAGSIRRPIQVRRNGRLVFKRRKSYGNYLTYVKKAAAVMEEPMIRRQLRRNLNKLTKSINEIHVDVNKALRNKSLKK